MDAIIFDIDGTLSNLQHRRHFVTGGEKDWDSFFAALGDDTPTEVCWLAEKVAAGMLFLLDEYPSHPKEFFNIYVCSGRPEKYRRETEEWLYTHCPILMYEVEEIFMRPMEKLYIPDYEVKRDMLNEIRRRGDNVRIVIDDRPRVIQMWKEEGLTVLEVDSGYD